jgi:peptidoglycan/LPS O-acetylase OafA/YrhL
MSRWAKAIASESESPSASAFESRRLVGLVVVVLALSASVAMFFAQVEVTDPALGETRSCGSAFDSATDRSGWELWWARDLDEPDDRVRSALVRSHLCPAAINRKIGAAVALGGAGVIAALLAGGKARSRSRRDSTPETTGGRIALLGRATSLAGGILTVAGVIAVILLVADADSTLFLYTDRLVVAVVGLIVLIPTMALFVIGRVLALVGAHLDRFDGERGHG